jgi:hypothetical protein
MATANDPPPPTPPTAGDADRIQAAPAPAPTDVQATPPAEEPPIKLAPRTQSPYVLEEQAHGIARLNQALVAVVLVLAFLLASFPVRNADFWMHLACGRGLLDGSYHAFAGEEPFSYTGARYWVNHAWLFDVVLYQLSQGLGGPLLVVLKALLVVAVGWTMLQVRRPRQDLWVPAVCTGLALLALGPRLQLGPALVSFLFLAVTLWLLQRSSPEEDAGTPAAAARLNALWLLPPLFALWVNLDGWFVLGLAAVALFVVGEALQGRVALPGAEGGTALTEGHRLRRLALVLVLSVAACLVNPYTFHAFTLPAAINPGQPAALLGDGELGILFASPFARVYSATPTIGGNVAGLAFFPLVLAGAASFALTWPNWRWWRVLVWLGFFLLAAWRWQAVPFFAIVGGPIAALNFADFAARRARGAAPAPAGDASGNRGGVTAVQWAVVLAVVLVAIHFGMRTTYYTEKLAGVVGPPLPIPFLIFGGLLLGVFAFGVVPTLGVFDRVFLTWSLGGRVLTLLAGIGLLVAAWPGWLAGSYQDATQARRVAWGVEPDPSLTGVAERLAELRRKGLLKDTDHGLALTIGQAAYCAWLCPAEKSFLDHRFNLFPEAAGAYVQARDAVEEAARPPADAPEGAPPTNPAQHWKAALEPLGELFRTKQINYLVLHAGDPADPSGQLLARMIPLLSDGQQWRLMYLDGRSAVFGWNDPEDRGAADRWGSEVYSTTGRAFSPETKEPVPETAPPDPVAVPDWIRYVTGSGPRPLPADEAALHLHRFNDRTRLYAGANALAFLGQAGTGWVGSAAPAGGPVATAQRLAFRVAVEGSIFPVGANAPAGDGRSPLMKNLADAESAAFLSAQDSGPPAYPLLAIRAARRAVAVNPRAADAYLALLQGYFDTRYQTRERRWCDQMPELNTLRHVQMVTALQHALAVEPDRADTHFMLAEVFGRYANRQNGNNGYLDLRLKHLEEALRLLQAAGPQPGEKPDDFQKRLEPLQEQVKALQRAVREAQNHFEVAAEKKQVLDKARNALGRGLAEQALTVLLDARDVELGPLGGQLELELLLTTGRVDRARQILYDPDSDIKTQLGPTELRPFLVVPSFTWYQLVLAAAEGDYRMADELFPTLLEDQEGQSQRMSAYVVSAYLALPIGPFGWGLAANPRELPLAYLALLSVERLGSLLETPVRLQRQGVPPVELFGANKAELTVLRGLLVLEAGDPGRAATTFHEAEALSPLDFPGRAAAERCLYLINEAAPRKDRR